MYGAIWTKCPSVAYLEGHLKSNKYGTPLQVNYEIQLQCISVVDQRRQLESPPHSPYTHLSHILHTTHTPPPPPH